MNYIDPRHIHISDYSYPLPDERIAKFPIARRDHSKLLIYNKGEVSSDVFYNLPQYLPKGALMVFNNTKVIQARMHFRKDTGALIEVFLLEPADPSDYELMFQTTDHCAWYCLVGNLKKWKEGTLRREVEIHGQTIVVCATRGELHGTSHRIDFEWTGDFSFAEIIDVMGELPIPPYLNRETQESDKTTYQTVYSKIKGSVAAPTAGLHFTPEVLTDLDAHGIQREELTLHVGAGTFKPVKSEEIEGHEMHTEYVSVRRDTIQKLIDHEGCAISVEALKALLAWMDARALTVLHSSTQIIIAPGYDYHIVKMLVTNFHQPQSTLLLLVSAFVKGDWHKIYDYALSHDFRFLSYGDSSLLIP